MRTKPQGVIDSLNFRSSQMESYFSDDENYSIETIKGIGVFEPDRWVKEFKKPLTRNIIEAKILNTSTGLILPLKRHSRSQDMQVIEFAGLHGYTDKSMLLSELLNALMESIQDELITRLDVAIDFKGKIPTRVIRALRKNRRLFVWKNSMYMKTEKEKSTNQNINICMYRKDLKKNDIDYELHRLEFSFKSTYFRNKYKVENLEDLYKKMEKTIKKIANFEVIIKPL